MADIISNYSNIFNASELLRTDDDMFFTCTVSGRVIFTASSLKDYLESDLTGRNLNDFLTDAMAANLISSAHDGTFWDFNCEMMGKPFKCVLEPGENNFTIILFPLVSGGKAFIRQSSARFLTREITASLSLISASLELVKMRVPTLPEVEMPMAVINQNVYRLLRLSRNISDYALFQSGQLKLNASFGDIGSFCKSLWERLYPTFERMGITASIQLPAERLMCSFDDEKVERMLLNLVSNALRSDRGHFLKLTLAEKESAVTITVSDRGCGIPQSAMRSIFDLHCDTTPELSIGGAGFGLAITKAYAETHGGSIVISSSDFSGTSACITLPRGDEPAEPILRSPSTDYAGGFDHLMLELSTALPSAFYK